MKIINPNELREGVVPGPKPVTLVTCGSYNNANIITVSYAGQLSDKLMYIAIRPSRYSNKLIKDKRKFGINYMDTKFVKEVDYCGLVSGRNIDKFKATRLTREKGISEVPLIAEAALSLECEVRDGFRIGEHDIFVGEVKSIRRKGESIDWLFHDGFDYFGQKGFVGEVYKIGRHL